MLLDECIFEDECFDITVGEYKLNISDLCHQRTELCITGILMVLLEITSDTILQILRLADIDNLSGGIQIDIYTR